MKSASYQTSSFTYASLILKKENARVKHLFIDWAKMKHFILIFSLQSFVVDVILSFRSSSFSSFNKKLELFIEEMKRDKYSKDTNWECEKYKTMIKMTNYKSIPIRTYHKICPDTSWFKMIEARKVLALELLWFYSNYNSEIKALAALIHKKVISTCQQVRT